MILVLFYLIVPFVKEPPKIDGFLEEVWKITEPIRDFVQEGGKPASESTHVYILQDDANLYIAFECFSNNAKPVLKVRGWDDISGDYVAVYIDTYGDSEKAYFFIVSAAGTQSDGIILRSVNNNDYSWDGIWFSKVRLTKYGYNVEIKIPFKSVRYQIKDWGIQFLRYISSLNETNTFVPVKMFEGVKISNFKKITVMPNVKGRYLEVYPVGILKYSDGISLNRGLDISYNPYPSFGLNLTFSPDFAEIEADPFTVNLSKYSIYLSERRPFFVEGKELFKIHISNFSMGTSPIKILYTRNIGKLIDDTIIVPIIFGLKNITRFGKFENAFMYVLTNKAGNEPLSHYLGFRLKGSISPYLSCGFTYVGKENVKSKTNVGALDITFLKNENDFVFQFSYGDSSGKTGPAMYLNYTRINNKFFAIASGKYINSNYSINEIGFAHFKGYSIDLGCGPIVTPNRTVKYLLLGIGSKISKEDYIKRASKGIFFFSFVHLKKTNLHGSFSISDHWEDTSGVEFNIFTKSVNVNLDHKFSSKIYGGFWGNLNYGFNWNTYYTCFYANYGFNLGYNPISNVEIALNSNFNSWWDENSKIFDILFKETEENYIRISPSFSYFLNTKLKFSFNAEFVYQKSRDSIIRSTINPLISYNLSPKSWIYFVYNITYEKENILKKTNEGLTFKVRYLYYF